MASILRTRAVVSNPSGGGDSLMTYYWDSAGGTPTQVMTEAQARVRAFWVLYASDIPLSASVIFNPVGDEIEETTGTLISQYTASGVANVNGTGTLERLPYQNQALIRLNTSTFIAGRKLRGRQNIPLVSEGASNSGFPSSAYLTVLQNCANLLGTSIVTPINQRVWSRPKPGRPGLSAPVTSRTCAPTWSVLRSRR